MSASGVTRQARAVTRHKARTFSLAARLLPRDVRDDVRLLYLVFRTLDDLVDDGDPDAETRVAATERWAASGARTSPEADVLAAVDARHALPRAALTDFCAGMRDDLAGWRPDREQDVDRYCYRVAGTVGLTLAAVLGSDDSPQTRAAAIALGIAMQRTNILRDIDEDLASGRCYLARATLERFGAATPGARSALLRDQIARADARYAEGLAGVGALRRGRGAIRAAAAMYQEILRQIEREQLAPGLRADRPRRAVVSRTRKLRVIARTTTTATRSRA